MNAHYKRAKLLMKKGMFEEAVREYEWIYLADQSRENKWFLEVVKMRFKISKKKDHYKTLGIGTAATIQQTKKAYRELASKHHPDKYQNKEYIASLPNWPHIRHCLWEAPQLLYSY
jgi:hypothetical protein